MENLILIVHFLTCFFLIGTILLQAGKGADMGAVFGGGGGQTVFGGRGPTTFLNKITCAAAILFIVTSLMLAQLNKTSFSESVIDKASATNAIEVNEAGAVVAPVEEKKTEEASTK